MVSRKIQPGDFVIYQMTKQSSHPTLRAKTVSPSMSGEDYRYIVEKFWLVRETTEDGQLVVQTRRGKVRTVSPDDPNLKRANIWHRWMNRGRFPEMGTNSNENQMQISGQE